MSRPGDAGVGGWICSLARPPILCRATLQTSPRPDIYRNIFQAYGTYIAPIRQRPHIDFESGAARWESKEITPRIDGILPRLLVRLFAVLPHGRRA